MTDIQRVMKSSLYVRHFRSTAGRVVLIKRNTTLPDSNRPIVFVGHTWTEAFRKAALHIVTRQPREDRPRTQLERAHLKSKIFLRP